MVRRQADLAHFGLRLGLAPPLPAFWSYEREPATFVLRGCREYFDCAEARLRK